MSKDNFGNLSVSSTSRMSNIPSVLVTGANGFVGANLCKRLINDGYKVIAGVRKSADLASLDGIEVEYRYGDIAQPETLLEMVKNVDYVIHNAGIVKAKKKQNLFDINEKGTQGVFEAILKNNPNVKKVIYISSLAAVGDSIDNKPVTEDDSPHPITTYGKSKLAGENAALSFQEKLNVVSIRPPGIYGPGDKEILTFFETVNNRIKPYIGNINRRLQLVHVDDLCRGISMALRADTKSGSIYFICEKQSYSMKELIALLEEGCGKKAFPLIIPSVCFKIIAIVSEILFKIVRATPMLTREKANELLASWEVSTVKAKREIGFESEINFEEGTRETYKWYRKEGWLK